MYAKSEGDGGGFSLPSEYATVQISDLVEASVASLVHRGAPTVARSTSNGLAVSVSADDADMSRNAILIEGPIDMESNCCTGPELSDDGVVTLANAASCTLVGHSDTTSPRCSVPDGGEEASPEADALPRCVSCSAVVVPAPSPGWSKSVRVEGLQRDRVYAIQVLAKGADYTSRAGANPAIIQVSGDITNVTASGSSGGVPPIALLIINTIIIIIVIIVCAFIARVRSRRRARLREAATSAELDDDDDQSPSNAEMHELRSKAERMFRESCKELLELLFHKLVDISQMEVLRKRVEFSPSVG